MPQLRFSEVDPNIGSRFFARGAAMGRFGGAQELTFGQQLGDVALAVPRGIEAAVQDVYGLADAVLLDKLPNYDTRFLGRSRTAVGGVIEGITNFAAGFIPISGAVGKIGALSKLGRFGKATLAGALTDIAVFDAHEERFSNLIQSFPSLRNPVSEFLAASPDDSQATGRLKNALEGLLVGTAVEPLILGVKAIRAQVAARAKGLGPKAIHAAIRDAVPEAEMRSALDAADRTPIDPDNPRFVGKPESIGTVLESTPETPGRILRQLLVDQDVADSIADDIAHQQELGFQEPTAPRKLSNLERLERGLEENSINLEPFQGLPQGHYQFFRAMERLFAPFVAEEVAGYAPEKLATYIQAHTDDVVDIVHGAESRAQVLARASEGATTLTEVAGNVVGWKNTLISMIGEVTRTFDEAISAPEDVFKVRGARAFEDLEFFADLAGPVLGMTSEMGRAFRALGAPMRTMLGELRERGDALFKRTIDEHAASKIASLGGEEAARRALAKIRALAGDGGVRGAANVMGVMRSAWDPQAGMNMLNDVWINGLLSGPRTLTITAMGGVLTSVLRPIEMVVGGVLTGKPEEIRTAIRQGFSLFRQSQEALSAGWAAAKNRRSSLTPANTVVDIRRGGRINEARAIAAAERGGLPTPGPFDPAVLGVDEDSFVGRTLRVIDRVVGTMTAMIGGIDEAVKTMNIRSMGHAELMRRAERIPGLTGEQVIERVESQMEKLIVDGQLYSVDRLKREGFRLAARDGLTGVAAVRRMRDYVAQNFDEELSAVADIGLDRAIDVTQTRTLERGTLGHSLQQIVTQHPFLRLVAAPFIRTPTNLLIFARRRLDLIGPVRYAGGLLTGNMPRLEETKNAFLRDMLSGDPRRKADAVGRVVLGTSVTSAFFGLTAAGKITGKGPDEPNLQRSLRQAGWQPYSLRIGDRWVSYQRLDPWASLIGVAADLYEYSQWADTSDQNAVEVLGSSVTAAVMNQLTEKSYLTGIRNLVGLMTEPERRAQTYFEQLFGSLLVPGAVASAVDVGGDSEMREVRGVLDAVRSRIPGLSARLEPRRNLLGEPIARTKRLGYDELGSLTNIWMPIAYSEVSDSVVDTGLAELHHGFGAPQTSRGGVDLLAFRSKSGQTAFDRWQELHGQVTVRGKTLRQSLSALFQSGDYQRLPREGSPDIESPRVGIVENMIRQYRDVAFDRVLKEYPALRVQYRELGLLKRRRSLGTPTREVDIGFAGISARLPRLVRPTDQRVKETF